MNVLCDLITQGFFEIDTCRQWSLYKRVGNDGMREYCLIRLASHDESSSLHYIVRSGRQGEPVIIADPDSALEPAKKSQYCDLNGTPITPHEKIAGLIFYNENGKVIRRGSITHLLQQGCKIEISETGTVSINGKVFWIWVLLRKDGNRIINYDAFLYPFVPPQEKIRVLELEELGTFFHKMSFPS